MNPKVLVGITGGIAAYKAADVVSQLVKAGCDTRVVMTQAATKFVAPLTFAALTQQKVLTSIFPDTNSGGMDVIYPHLYPATEADVFLVVPATANTISKLACGQGDDIISCSALSLKQSSKRFFCPAMNLQMWEQPIVKDNVQKLKTYGWKQIGPEKGRMACGTEGYGRMSEPSIIAKIILDSL